MTDKNINNPHWSFWLISGLMLVWNVLGCINFVMQMNPEMLISYRPTEQAIIAHRPLWATLGFALAVFAGALGCLLLMLKRSLAQIMFLASLAGVLLTMVHTLAAGIQFGGAELVGIIAMPIMVALFLIWYARFALNKGWISR